MKLPRTVRLDVSDAQVFEKAALPGEWAVPGSFAFRNCRPEQLDPKSRLAFASGWLGTESFGWSTLVEVAEIDEAGFFQVVERLARHFVEHYGAPSLVEALATARAEVDDAAGLCEHGVHTLLALEREMADAAITERFRVIQPSRAKDHAQIWSLVEDDQA